LTCQGPQGEYREPGTWVLDALRYSHPDTGHYKTGLTRLTSTRLRLISGRKQWRSFGTKLGSCTTTVAMSAWIQPW
jgi:hypothetical protein